MPEKKQIRIPNVVKKVLQNDTREFFFVKNNGSLNMNAFMNTLIVNYYDSFQDKLTQEYDQVLQILEEECHGEKIKAAKRIVKKSLTDTVEGEKDVFLNFKPTVRGEYSSCAIVNEIKKFVDDQDINESQYYRALLLEYCSLPKNRREQILFEKEYQLILCAIKAKKKISFLHFKKEESIIVSPYKLVHNNLEMYNYLLNQGPDGNPYKSRLALMRNVRIIGNDTAEISKNSITVFGMMTKYGVEYRYPMNADDFKPIKIRLSKNGEKRYTHSPVHRPQYTKIEGNVYEFECSFDQIMEYFLKFGKDAEVLEPIELRNLVKQFYQNTLEMYEEKL